MALGHFADKDRPISYQQQHISAISGAFVVYFANAQYSNIAVQRQFFITALIF